MPSVSILLRLPGWDEDRKLVPLSGKDNVNVYTWAWSARGWRMYCWGSYPEPMCLTWSLIWPSLFCSVEAASIGFIIVIDRRRDKWSSIKASLTRIAVNIHFLCCCYKSNLNCLFKYFMSKSQGKGNYFMQGFGKVFVAEAVCHIHVPSATCWSLQTIPEHIQSFLNLRYWSL